MKRILFIAILLYLLPVVGRCQIAGVMTEYGEMLPSRGSFAIVKGTNLAPATELAVDVVNLPRSLGGVVVEIDGVQCGLRYVSHDTIRLVIPDEVPFIPPVRLRPNTLTIKTIAGATLWSRRVYLNDTSPWLIPNKATQWPVGIQFSASGYSGVIDGVIEPGARVQLWATGARSFYPADWVSYAVWIIDRDWNVYSTSATVSRFTLIEGMDLVTFDVPAEWTGLGECRLLLQTPSAFSQEVEVVL